MLNQTMQCQSCRLFASAYGLHKVGHINPSCPLCLAVQRMNSPSTDVLMLCTLSEST